MEENPHESPADSSKKKPIPADLSVRSSSERLLQPWQHVQPLSHELYDRVFYGAFVPNSTEYRKSDGSEGPMLFRTHSIMNMLPQRSSILSIGAGDGMFDDDLYGADNLTKYRAIEPNEQHVTKLNDRISGKENWGDRGIVPSHFDETFDPSLLGNQKFDAILMTHCAYFLKDPVAAMIHARSMLNEDGALIVLHQTHDEGICRFFRRFEQRFGLQWDPNAIRQDHAMSTSSISEMLRTHGLSHYQCEDPAQIHVDAFHSTDASHDPAALDLISFFMNTDVRNFPQTAIDEMVADVRDHSTLRESGHHEFDHPQGFIVLPHESSQVNFTALEGMQHISLPS